MRVSGVCLCVDMGQAVAALVQLFHCAWCGDGLFTVRLVDVCCDGHKIIVVHSLDIRLFHLQIVLLTKLSTSWMNANNTNVSTYLSLMGCFHWCWNNTCLFMLSNAIWCYCGYAVYPRISRIHQFQCLLVISINPYIPSGIPLSLVRYHCWDPHKQWTQQNYLSTHLSIIALVCYAASYRVPLIDI